MRPFKMFFGLAIGFIIFSFIVKVALFAFVAAAVMSIVYAIYRRVKDFITYDRYGEYYIKGYPQHQRARMQHSWNNEIEPLFQENIPNYHTTTKQVHFIKTI